MEKSSEEGASFSINHRPPPPNIVANFTICIPDSSSDEEEKVSNVDHGRKRVSAEKTGGLVKVRKEEDDDNVPLEEEPEFQDFEDILEDEDDELDIRDWKLTEIQQLLQKMKDEMGDSTAKRPVLSHGTINRFLDPVFQTLSAQEIPPELTVDDYIIQLAPPSNNKKYDVAVENVKEQMRKRKNPNILINCPIDSKCITKCNWEWDAVTHIQTHLQIKLFKCGAVDCTFESTRKSGLLTHINIHLNLVFKCEECQKKFRSQSGFSKHMNNGHLIPTGSYTFVTVGPGKIKLLKYRPEWINESDDLSSSLGFSTSKNILPVVKQLWNDIERECKQDKINDKWVSTCGSAREEVRKGLRMCPEKTFPLDLFALGTIAISQLKWYARKYYDSVHILATTEAQFYLSEFSNDIKEKLNAVKEQMPPIIWNQVEEYGEAFAM